MSKMVTIFDIDFQIILDQTTTKIVTSRRRKPFFACNPISWILKLARLHERKESRRDVFGETGWVNIDSPFVQDHFFKLSD